MAAAADGNMSVTVEEEAERDEEAKLRILKGAAFLTTVASAGMMAGFGSTLALAKKKSPAWFRRSSDGGGPRERSVCGPQGSGLGVSVRLVWSRSAQPHSLESPRSSQLIGVQTQDAVPLPDCPKDPRGSWI
ncbi:transmembrane protein 242 isoform 2-T2 [Lycodopsis pacificus]